MRKEEEEEKTTCLGSWWCDWRTDIAYVLRWKIRSIKWIYMHKRFSRSCVYVRLCACDELYIYICMYMCILYKFSLTAVCSLSLLPFSFLLNVLDLLFFVSSSASSSSLGCFSSSYDEEQWEMEVGCGTENEKLVMMWLFLSQISLLHIHARTYVHRTT